MGRFCYVLIAFSLLICMCIGLAKDDAIAESDDNSYEASLTDMRDGNDSEGVELPFSEFSIEELLDLRDAIDTALIMRGYNPYYDIERAEKGEAVTKVQQRLKELGYYDAALTGKMDNATQKAMKLFEKANNLPNDGLPSREDQIVLFSDSAIPQTKNPVAENDKGNDKAKVEDEEKYSDYGVLDYEECFRYPEKHLLEKVTIKCKVVQVLGSRSSGFQLRVAVNGSSDDIVYVFVNFDPGYNILENDRLTIYAQMWETVTYTSVLGQEITIPAAIANTIVLR